MTSLGIAHCAKDEFEVVWKIIPWTSWKRHIYRFTLLVCKAVLRIFVNVSVWPRCLITSRWKLCGEGEILFVFSESVSFALYPQSFNFLLISLWTSWKRHLYGYTLSVFKSVLRIFANVFVWPRCLIASRWKLCSEGEILFAFSENVGLSLEL